MIENPFLFDMPHLWRKPGEPYAEFLTRLDEARLRLLQLHAAPGWRDYKRRLDEAENIAEHGYVDKGG